MPEQVKRPNPWRKMMMIGKKRWIQRSLRGETRVAADKGQHPNTSKLSKQDQNKLRKGILILTQAVK